MTIFDTRSTDTAVEPELSWSSPDANLWVAKISGDYAGMIEFVDGHFAVQNALGEVVATGSSIPEAKDALAAHTRSNPEPSAARFLATLASTSPKFMRAPKTGYVRRGSVHAG